MTLFDTIAFHWPQLLWLLLIPLGLAGWELTRGRRSADTAHPKILRAEAAPGFLTLVAGPGGGATSRRLRWRLWLGLALVSVALARPQWGQVEEQVFDQSREILIAVDLSRSMLAPDVPPSRLERAKLLITSLLERLEGERVGLIVFAGTAFLQSPLSADYEILREFLPALGPDFLPEGGTNYTALLQTALEAFGKTGTADRFLIVLSDGESQTEDWQRHVSALRERNVKALCLGIGTTDGAMLPDGKGGFVKDERGAVVLSRLNPSTLEDLARRTSGVYRDASSWVDLAQLLQDTVEAGRQGEFTEVSRARRIERFQWFLAPALLALLASFWREFPVNPRPRAVSLAPTSRQPNPAGAASTAVASLIAVMAALILSDRARAAPPDTAPFAAPLNEIVGRLAAKNRITAPDYAEMANATVEYGQRLLGAQQPPEAGAIADALQAVAAGEAMDPRAADWAKLRQELEAMKPPEQQDQQQQQQSDEDQKSSDEQKQQQQQQNQSGQGQDQKEKSEKSESEQSQDQQQSDEPGDQSDSQNQDQSEQQQPQESESAFGDMQEPPPDADAQPQPEPPSDNQKVGGQSDRRSEAEQNPALTVPLQKLEQLKQQDSPAKLYQLMQDPNARPTTKGRDW